MQQINNYLQNVNRLFQTGNAREHSYRGDLQQLLNEIINDKDIVVTNEPARIVNVGAPDYSITKKDIPLGYIEAKDINKPQMLIHILSPFIYTLMKTPYQMKEHQI